MRLLAALGLLACLGLGRMIQAQVCPPARTALVLSGGGAKGFAHIGVLRTLDSLGVHPDLVVGTSMGAILGAMYASGYTGRQIDSLTRSLPLTNLFTRYEPRAPRALGDLQPLIVWEQGEGGFVLQRAAVREGEVNSLLDLGLLRGNLMARGTFDSLPIPFRAVATDLSGRQLVILRSGDLAQAVRASLSIPLVFAPERIDGRYLGDGALVANIPVEVARREGAQRVIVSDATEHLSDSLNLASPIALADQLLGFLFRQPSDSLRPRDIFIRPRVEGFPSLDFSEGRVSSLIELGRDAASAALAGAECLPTRPPAETILPARLEAVEMEGGRPADQQFLRQRLHLDADSIDLKALRAGLREIGASEKYTAVWLHPAGSRDSLRLAVAVRAAPRRIAGVGITYDNDIGGRMWIGGVDRNLLRRNAEASLVFLLGELRQEVILGLRSATVSSRALTPLASLGLARESVRQFDPSGDEIKPIRIREAVGFAGLEQLTRGGWVGSLGVEARAWHDSLAGDRGAVGAAFHLRDRERSLLHLDAAWTNVYRRVEINGDVGARLGKLRLAPGLRFGWGEDLPVQQTFMLGGEDGFPGLHIGEQRGNREALVRLTATHPLFGPITARVELVSGVVATGGPVFASGSWSWGGRAGIGADTPIGPVRVEYGHTDRDRGAMFVRFGRWF